MVRVHHRGEGLTIHLPCAICAEPLQLAVAWLVFNPSGDVSAGEFVHKECVRGRQQELYGKTRLTFMRGAAALTLMAQSLQGPISRE